MYFYPDSVQKFQPLDECIQRYFFPDGKKYDFLSGDKPVITQGSCFAVNFAKALIRNNYPTAHLFVNEWINSTHANAIFFNHINTDGAEGYQPIFENSLYEKQVVDFLKQSVTAENRLAFIDAVKACGIFVLTIGVAPLWFDMQQGQYCLTPDKRNMKNFQMKTTGVDTNTNSIVFVLSQIKKINPDIQIYLTLSPAPLNATNEYPSVFEADCVSKSTLRVAIDNVIREYPDIHYWPSFEIVRWLGSHLEPVYGSDDGHPRHVSNWLVDKIVGKFIELNGGQLLDKETAAAPMAEVSEPFRLVRNF